MLARSTPSENRRMTMEGVSEEDLEDSMKSCLFYFADSARIVAAGPDLALQQSEGHFAAAWELRQELLAGESLLHWSGVSETLRQRIARLVGAAAALPEAAFAGNDASELFHPSWEQVRDAASRFLVAREIEQAG